MGIELNTLESYKMWKKIKEDLNTWKDIHIQGANLILLR